MEMSYSQLTQVSEQQIRDFMEISLQAKAAGDDDREIRYEDFAFGAWLLWSRLTHDEAQGSQWQQRLEDYERLRLLLHPEDEAS